MIVAAQNDPTYEYEDSSVEIRLSRGYVEYCRHVTPIYSRAATHFCKGALELDFKKRKNIYDEYQKIVYEQLPLIYLYSGLRISAVRNKFGNIKPTVLGGILHNLEEIYIKKGE